MTLSWCEGVDDAAVIALGENCPLLEVVDVQGVADLTDLAICTLAAGAEQLVELYVSEALITDESLFKLAECDHLYILSLIRCLDFTAEGVLYLAEYSGVGELDLWDCTQISADTREELIEMGMVLRDEVGLE